MTAKNVETTETISFDEFRAWLTGLIRGKNGTIPDVDDWKQVKIMDNIRQWQKENKNKL